MKLPITIQSNPRSTTKLIGDQNNRKKDKCFNIKCNQELTFLAVKASMRINAIIQQLLRTGKQKSNSKGSKDPKYTVQEQ